MLRPARRYQRTFHLAGINVDMADMQPFATLAAAHFYGAGHQAGTVGQMEAIPPDEGAGNPE
jgi:hypothetical protein